MLYHESRTAPVAVHVKIGIQPVDRVLQSRLHPERDPVSGLGDISPKQT